MSKKKKLAYDEMTDEQKKKYKRRKTAKRVTLTIVSLILIVFIFNFFLLPLSYTNSRVETVTENIYNNPYIRLGKNPLISAHRAGGDLAPEETLKAFRACMAPTDYRVDIVEFDLHLTKDNELVLLHDGTVDRTSNGIEHFGKKDIKVIDKTLAELKELNFGENFPGLDGSYQYRGKRGDEIDPEIKILTLDEVLTFLTNERPDDLNYIIEIKDGGKDGERAMDKLNKKMHEYNIVDKTIVGTFKDNVTRYIDKQYPDLIRSASIIECVGVYYSFLYGTKPSVNCDVLQIPANLSWVHFDSKAFIDYCHKYGLAVQYWTINDVNLAGRLVEYGADAIITDNPKDIYSVIYG